MNFSEGSVEDLARVRKVSKRRRAIGIFSLLIGIAMICVGVRMLLPDILANIDYEQLRERVKTDNDAPEKSGDEDTGQDSNNEDAAGDGGIDWNVLHDEVPAAVGWLRVDNTIMDYPVLQGDDNEYYLYHDSFGRESYSSAFLDYRAEPDGKAKIIYGHTHAIQAGFHDIGQADEQWSFDNIGAVHWSTPSAGERTYTPAFALHVFPDFQDIQRFEFDCDETLYHSRLREILDAHASRGEWNTTVIGRFDILGVDCVAVTPASREQVGLNYWWRITPEEESRAREAASVDAFRGWLRALYGQSTASSADAERLIDSADDVLTLACCSWPWDDHRTLLVCLR